MKFLSVFFVLCVAVISYAGSEGEDHDSCQGGSCSHSKPGKCAEKLSGPGPIHLVPSGRSPETDRKYLVAAEKAADVAFRLGYHVPPHQIIMAPSRELVGMVPVGGYAAPSYLDGQKIVEDGGSSAGVMEFVVDGCPTCRSFNRDTTSLIQQISINLHVIGHNDFGKSSYFQQSRPDGDPIAAKYELAKFMRDLYSAYDHDEVSMFYQLLESLGNTQDYAKGSYVSPDSLKNNPTGLTDLKRIVAKRKGADGTSAEPIYESKKFPASATPSVLQAFVANLPPGTPEWKSKMASLYEKSHNMFPTVVQQKIANEGWATFTQFLVAKHLDGYNDHKHLFSYADLLKGVAGNSIRISNPYWLGLECWKNIYEEFRARPEIASLSDEFEKDKRFVAHAHTYMATMDDHSFIRKALNEQWVRKHQLYLKREASPQELADRGIEINPMSPESYDIVLSISAPRIIDAIARAVGEKRKFFPRIHLVNMNHRGKEVLYAHEPFENLPLERFSAAQMVFLMSFLQEKPVSLDTIAPKAWMKHETVNDKIKSQIGLGGTKDDDDELRGRYRAEPIKVDMRIRISAYPDGTLKVYELPDAVVEQHIRVNQDQFGGLDNIKIEEQWLNQELTAQLQGAVDYYKLDLQKSVNSELADTIGDAHEDSFWDGEWFAKIGSAFTSKLLPSMSSSSASEGIVSSSATAGDAILEYKNMVEARLARAAKDALEGKAKFKTGKSGVKLRVLPIIPRFQHDQTIYNMLNSQKRPGPLDERYAQTLSLDIGVDDASDLGVGQGLPGDVIKKPPANNGEGQGDGEVGDEEGDTADQPGDPSEQQPDDVKESQGANDPSVMEVPLDLWAEILNSYLELPNPRNTKGGMKIKDEERGGVRTRDGEPVVWDQTVDEAIRWAIGSNPALLKAPSGETPAERNRRLRKLITEGLKILPSEEYRVKSWNTTHEPEYKAVVVFVLDLSGSMQGEPLQKSKEFIYNVVSFLRSKYPQVELRYVGYDTNAHEFPENKIFKTGLGGATDDSVGYKLANEILDEYNPREYNMYVYGTGDGGGHNVDATIEEMEKIYARVQHMGFIENQLGWTASPQLLEAIKGLSEKYGWFDYGIIDKDPGSVLGSLNEFFGKGKNAGRK